MQWAGAVARHTDRYTSMVVCRCLLVNMLIHGYSIVGCAIRSDDALLSSAKCQCNCSINHLVSHVPGMTSSVIFCSTGHDQQSDKLTRRDGIFSCRLLCTGVRESCSTGVLHLCISVR